MRFSTLCLIACVILVLTSCVDPTPAEIGANCKLNGRGKACTMVLYNSKGVQVQHESTDFNGIGYFSQVKPGTYTVKFMANDDEFYPAEFTVDVAAGASEHLDVELSQGPTASTE